MKVVQLITTLGFGGAEKICIELANGLAEQNPIEKVYLVSLFDHQQEHRPLSSISSKVELITLGKNKGVDLSIFNKVNNFFLKINPDIIHTHLTGAVYSSRFLLSRPCKAKAIHTVHNIADKDVSPLFQLFHRYAFKRNIIRPVAISPEVRSSIQSYYQIPEPVLIENFTSRPVLSSEHTNVQAEIDKYRRNSDTKVIVNIARINPQKNQQMLIDAFTELRDENVSLLIVGGPGGGFEELEAKLKQKAALTNNVHMIGNKVNVADYMMYADAFILSSDYEGLPVALLEALALGLVPISTPVGGVPSVISSEIGWLTRDVSKNSLKAAVLDFLHTPNSTLENMSEKAIQLFEEKYSKETAVSKYLNLYLESLSSEHNLKK